MAGLYLHIPYCKSKCHYCDFYSGSGLGHESEYIDALLAEFRLRAYEINEAFTTVYIGGGTPSSLSQTVLLRLLDNICEMVDVGQLAEYTVEVNPEDVNNELLATLALKGVTRISMGIQSLNDAELTAVGRRHTANKAIQSARLVAQYFTNYSCDLIFGLPGQTLGSLKASLEQLLVLTPPHLSVYLLSYEPGTRLYARLITGKIEEIDDETVQEMYSLITETLANAGYVHYEISNYALPGYESKHNSAYWFSAPYLGLGASAHSFDGETRRYNPSRISTYLERISEGKLAVIVEEENEDNKLNDIIITRLRTSHGLGTITDLTTTQYRALKPKIDELLGSGMLEINGENVRIPANKWLLSDNILRELIV